MDALLKAFPPFVGTLAALMPLFVSTTPLGYPEKLRGPVSVLVLTYIWCGFLLAAWLGPAMLYSPLLTFSTMGLGVVFLLIVIIRAIRTDMAPSSINTVLYVAAVGLITTSFSMSLPHDPSRLLIIVKDPAITGLSLSLSEQNQPLKLMLRNGIGHERGIIIDRRDLPDRAQLKIQLTREGKESVDLELPQISATVRGQVTAYEL